MNTNLNTHGITTPNSFADMKLGTLYRQWGWDKSLSGSECGVESLSCPVFCMFMTEVIKTSQCKGVG